jgi:hypothetical protein
MLVFAESVHLNGSSVGFGRGVDEEGNEVFFAGGWRAMYALGEAIEEAGEPLEVHLEEWQVLSIRPQACTHR